MAERKIRVLLATWGENGQDRSARVLALALRDAGIEVIFAGARLAVEQVAAAALQENVDVVAVGVAPGASLSLTRRLLESLTVLGIRKDLKVAVGGAVAPRDVPRLRQMGVEGIFPAGTQPAEIVAWFRGLAGDGNERGTV